MRCEYLLKVTVLDDGQMADRQNILRRPRSSRPRTGERRKLLQPFRIDSLPASWRGRIIELRSRSMSWQAIEQESMAWEWDKLSDELVCGHFADRRIPASTLHRWYDVRVLQPLGEVAAGSLSTDLIAAKVFGHDFECLDEGVKNALMDIVLRNANNAGSIASVLHLAAAL